MKLNKKQIKLILKILKATELRFETPRWLNKPHYTTKQQDVINSINYLENNNILNGDNDNTLVIYNVIWWNIKEWDIAKLSVDEISETVKLFRKMSVMFRDEIIGEC